MGDYNSKLYPEPDKKDIVKMKEFFKLKYTQKRFYKKDVDSEDSEDEKEKKKKPAKGKKKSTKKKD